MSINIRHSQNTLSKQLNLSLPEMSLNFNRFYPLKGFNKTNKPKWYDKLYINYTTSATGLNPTAGVHQLGCAGGARHDQARHRSGHKH